MNIIPEEYHCTNWFCKLYNHYLNPFGNWNEPLPYPIYNKIAADESFLPPIIWWNLRNPFHNFCHYWVGITPLGERYEWLEPEYNGWIRVNNDSNSNWMYSYWLKGKIKLPFWEYNNGRINGYIGWLRRGNFGLALRKVS